MNLCQYLTTTVRTQPDKTICICGRERKTAAELLARVCALANALAKDVAVQPGDVVALAARNSDVYFEVVLAVMAIGAVVAPLNWRWSLQVRPCPRMPQHGSLSALEWVPDVWRRMQQLLLKLANQSCWCLIRRALNTLHWPHTAQACTT